MKATSRLLLAPLLLATADVSPAASILIDFGKPEYPSPESTESAPQAWNNVGITENFDKGTSVTSAFTLLENMRDSTGATTTVDLRYLSSNRDDLSGRKFAWGLGGNVDFSDQTQSDYPLSATRDAMYLNDGVGSGTNKVTLTFAVTGLVAGKAYDFVFYGGYDNDGTANRAASIWASGTSSVSQDADLPGGPVTLADLVADEDGTIQFTWTNDAVSSSQRSALWATMEIIPEPSSALLAGSALLGGCFLRRRRA